jgi:hypothetical protein
LCARLCAIGHIPGVTPEAEAEFEAIADRYLALPEPRRHFDTWEFPRPETHRELAKERLIRYRGTAKGVFTAYGYQVVMARLG